MHCAYIGSLIIFIEPIGETGMHVACNFTSY